MTKIEDKGPLGFLRKRKEEPVVPQKPNQTMIPSSLEKKRKTIVGLKSLTPKETIKILSSEGFSSSDNEANSNSTAMQSTTIAY